MSCIRKPAAGKDSEHVSVLVSMKGAPTFGIKSKCALKCAFSTFVIFCHNMKVLFECNFAGEYAAESCSPWKPVLEGWEGGVGGSYIE